MSRDANETTPPPERKRVAALVRLVETLKRWALPTLTVGLSIVVSAFGWGVAWANFNGRIDGFDKQTAALDTSVAALDTRVAALEEAGPPVERRLDELERGLGGIEKLLLRQSNVEKFLSKLVCRQWPEDCPAAIDLAADTTPGPRP